MYEIAHVYERMIAEGLNDIVGGGDAQEIGVQNFTAVKHLALLEPDMKVLDFGCGCGRLAIPMLNYLSADGKYIGCDIVPRLIDFCQRELGNKYPNAEFYLTNSSNKLYDKFKTEEALNLNRIETLAQLDERSFDIITAFSVFTHLNEEETQHYLQLLSRLLKPGGKLLASCFLINESSVALIDQKRSSIKFDDDVHAHKREYVNQTHGELNAVGFHEDVLLSFALTAGLEPFAIYYGQWCGRKRRHSYQDIIVFEDYPKLPSDFQAKNYLQLNPDITKVLGDLSEDDAAQHFLEHGYYESRKWQ